MEITKNQAAFATITAAALATAGSVMAATFATATVAKVAYVALSVLAGTLNLAAITSYFEVSLNEAQKQSTVSASEYFDKLKDHTQKGIPAVLSVISQALLQAIIQGVTQGVSTLIKRKIAGPDVTVHNTEQQV